MSRRFESFRARFTGKGPNGRKLCVWCGAEVPPGKRRWCSEKCVHEMKIQHWPQYWAAQVIKRDKGVCRLCGFDSHLVDRIIHHVRTSHASISWLHDRKGYEEGAIASEKTYRFIQQHLKSQGFDPYDSLVEADHIIPVVEGGENMLENGRTLCQPCHKRVTAELARRRKWERKEKGTLFAALESGQAPG